MRIFVGPARRAETAGRMDRMRPARGSRAIHQYVSAPRIRKRDAGFRRAAPADARASRRGGLLRIAIRWMPCPARVRAVWPSSTFPNDADAAVPPAARRCGPGRMLATAMTGRESDGGRQGASGPWQRGRCRRGDGHPIFLEEAVSSRRRRMPVVAHHPPDRDPFFRTRQSGRGGGGCPSWHIIHLIAIGKSPPARETGDAPEPRSHRSVARGADSVTAKIAANSRPRPGMRVPGPA